MLNEHGGVCSIFGLPSLTSSISAILLSPFELSPSYQRIRGRMGSSGRRSERPPFFRASHFTPGPSVFHSVYHALALRGGRSLLHYHGRLSLREGPDRDPQGGGSGVPAGADVWDFEGPDREDRSRTRSLIEGGAASSRWRPRGSATAAGRSPTATHAGNSSRAGPAPGSRSDTRPRRSSSP